MIRAFRDLDREEIVRLAREQADSGEPCAHGFDIGSTEACTWERTYTERLRELEEVEG